MQVILLLPVLEKVKCEMQWLIASNMKSRSRHFLDFTYWFTTVCRAWSNVFPKS